MSIVRATLGEQTQLMDLIMLQHTQPRKRRRKLFFFFFFPPPNPRCVFVCRCVHQCGGEERSLRQYWYTSWPDQKTPDKAPPLLELVQEVERAREKAPPSSGPTIVHCRCESSLFVMFVVKE